MNNYRAIALLQNAISAISEKDTKEALRLIEAAKKELKKGLRAIKSNLRAI